MQSAVVQEVERWPHTPMSVSPTPVRRSIVFLNLLTTLRKYKYVMKKGAGSEYTVIIGPSKSVLVYAVHSLEYS